MKVCMCISFVAMDFFTFLLLFFYYNFAENPISYTWFTFITYKIWFQFLCFFFVHIYKVCIHSVWCLCLTDSLPGKYCGRSPKEIDGAVIYSSDNQLYANSGCVLKFKADDDFITTKRIMVHFENLSISDCGVKLSVFYDDDSYGQADVSASIRHATTSTIHVMLEHYPSPRLSCIFSSVQMFSKF